MCVTLISFIHVTTKDSSTCTTMLVLACEPATSANTSIDGRGSTTSPYNMDRYTNVTITLTMIIVFINNKYLHMIVSCFSEIIRIAYVLSTWLVQSYTGSRGQFSDD